MAGRIFGAVEFEAERPRLKGIAYRMLGSRTEAEDAVQEAWLRLSRTGTEHIESPRAWLTTVIARICLDMLRTRKLRREEALAEDGDAPQPVLAAGPDFDFEMADTVGLALLIVLETLSPAERLAFVLHDMFDMPFEEIAPVVGRSEEATRQMASRARRRVRGAPAPEADRSRKREVAEAFLKAARGGDMRALLSVLDPDVVFRADAAALKAGAAGIPGELRGAQAVAAAFSGKAQAAYAALVDGELGLLVAPAGRLLLVVRLQIEGDRIVGMEATADPDRLRTAEFSALD